MDSGLVGIRTAGDLREILCRMYQQDYILRIIETVGAIFRRMVFLIQNGCLVEALMLSREAVKLASDTDPVLIDSLTADGILQLFSIGGTLDASRAALIGMALRHRASALAASGDLEEAALQREKAEALLAVAIQAEPELAKIVDILS